MHRTNVDFLTNKVHNCEYSQVYNMTENLTLNDILKTTVFKEHVLQNFTVYTVLCINFICIHLCILTEHGLRWKLDIRRLEKFQSL
jgi:hypothetical protein